jgi:hypothetical protein
MVLVAAGVIVADTVIKTKRDAYLTPDLNAGFNAQEIAPGPAVTTSAGPVERKTPELSAPPIAGMPLRDAVASPGLMGGGARMLPPPPRGGAGAASAYRPSSMYQKLLSAPAKFMVQRSHLGNAARFRQFVSNPSRVQRYLDWPVTRGVMENPAALKALVSQPAVVQAFLTSPAMQDPNSVKALVSSPLLAKLLQSPAAVELLKDPNFVSQVLMNPETMQWLMKNPTAMKSISQIAPNISAGLSGAIGSLPGRPF